jgi:membrane-bound acyltransferase YfiQ involved in biofilm formation
MKNHTLKLAGINALGTAMYIALVSCMLFYAPQIFNKNSEDTVFIPIAMLLLFVVSASITSLLVLGRPMIWYLEGKKKKPSRSS